MKKLVATVLVCSLLLIAATRMNVVWIGDIDGSGLTTFKLPTTAAIGAGTVVSTSGTITPGHCGQWVGTATLGDAGFACGSGGGGGGTVGTPDMSAGGSTIVNRIIGIAKGTVSLSAGTWTYPGGTVAASSSAAVQEFPIVTGLTGDLRYVYTLLYEQTQCTQTGSITATTAGIGRPGSSTDGEMNGPLNLMQSSGGANFGFDSPQAPIIGTSNTYSLVLTIRTTGGNINVLGVCQVGYEIAAYSVQ